MLDGFFTFRAHCDRLEARNAALDSIIDCMIREHELKVYTLGVENKMLRGQLAAHANSGAVFSWLDSANRRIAKQKRTIRSLVTENRDLKNRYQRSQVLNDNFITQEEHDRTIQELQRIYKAELDLRSTALETQYKRKHTVAVDALKKKLNEARAKARHATHQDATHS
jgi:hypothetical protein